MFTSINCGCRGNATNAQKTSVVRACEAAALNLLNYLPGYGSVAITKLRQRPLSIKEPGDYELQSLPSGNDHPDA